MRATGKFLKGEGANQFLLHLIGPGAKMPVSVPENSVFLPYLVLKKKDRGVRIYRLSCSKCNISLRPKN